MKIETCSQNTHWQSLFVGREKELGSLKLAWEKTKSGDPQFVVLLAETGTGKTRLVQQFYSWLSKGDNKLGYWPDWLAQERNSLRINPTFKQDYQASIMPWLWWGIRFTNSNLRNRAEIPECALVNSLPHLLPHFVSLQKTKETLSLSNSIRINLLTASAGVLSLFTLGPVAAALVVAIGAASTVKDSVSVIKNYFKIHQINKSVKNVAQLYQEQQQSAVKRIQDYFEALLDKGANGKGSIPIVLIIDDAQWTDIDTLLFVEQLYRKAVKNNWPLMILSTHWKYEWNLQMEQSHVAHDRDKPESVADIVKRNPKLFTRWNPQIIGKINSKYLKAILSIALPGLLPKQRDTIINCIDGNPGFLFDLIRLLITKPKFFESNDPKKSMTSWGEEKLLSLTSSLNHYQLNKERFNSLEDNMKDLLAWSSHQGTRFVEQLTLEVARRIQNNNSDDLSAILKQAHNPYALIESVSRLSSEFCHRNIYEIANDELHELENHYQYFRKTLLNILQEWYGGDQFKQLDKEEWEQLLKLLVNELKVVVLTKEQHITLGNALADLIRYYYARGQDRQHVEMACQLVATMPEDGWDFGLVDILTQWESARVLQNYSWHEESIKLWDSLIYKFELGTANEILKQEEVITHLVNAYMNRGVVLWNQNKLDLAIKSYDQAIALLDALGNQWTPETQKNLALTYMNRGNALWNQNKLDLAIKSYDQAIALLDALGDQSIPEIQKTQALTYMNRGNALSEWYKLGPAIESYDRSIELLESLRDTMGAQWTLEMQHGLALAYMNRGYVLWKQKKPIPAIESYAHVIKLMKLLRKSLDDQWTPTMQNNLAMTYMNRGNALVSLDKLNLAIKSYNLSIKLREMLRKVLDEQWTPTMQNGLAIAYRNCGDVLQRQDKLGPAIESYDNSIELRKSLRDTLGSQFTPTMQNGLAMTYINRGHVQQRQDELYPAINSYDCAIELLESLRDTLGAEWTPEMQNGLNLTYSYRAGVLLDLGGKT